MNLVKGKIYDISSPDLRRSEIGRFIKYEDRHCQLHGELIAKEALFQRIKVSGRESYMFSIDPAGATIAERTAPFVRPEGMKP